MSKPTVVIVGANLAGGRAVESLRKEGFDGRVVMIGEEQQRPYERPPMSKEVLRGEWPADKAFLRPPEWYPDNDVELMLGVRATMIDVVEQTVMAGGTLVQYDALLLATGGSPRSLPLPGAELPGVHALRTMNDSLLLGARLRDGVPVVVIGAGFIGCEVASSARALGCDVTVIDVLAVPFERALGSQIGEVWTSLMLDHGVTMHMRAQIDRIEGSQRAEAVRLSDGTRIEAGIVVMGVGISPNDELAREAGITCSNGIDVDEHCMTSARGVFAAGDVANHIDPILGARIRVEHWQNAQNQGAAAARAMLGNQEPFAEVPWFWTDQFDVNLQMFGHPLHYDRIVFRGDVANRNFSAFYKDGERVVAALGVGRAKDARAGRVLIEKAVTVEDAALADEGTDLRALVPKQQ